MFASQQVIYLLHIFRPIRHIVLPRYAGIGWHDLLTRVPDR